MLANVVEEMQVRMEGDEEKKGRSIKMKPWEREQKCSIGREGKYRRRE
jgi:hypothetical protein